MTMILAMVFFRRTSLFSALHGSLLVSLVHMSPIAMVPPATWAMSDFC